MSFFSTRNFSWFFSLILSGFLLACQNDSPSMDPDPMPKGTEPMPEPPVAHPKNTQYPICPNGFCFKNPSTGGNTIRGLWGSGDKDIWAVGDYGTILHYDGKIWSLVPSPTQANLKAVWGSSYDNVYAIGEQGTLLHYNESLGTWNSLSLGISSTLWGIWGDGPNHIWLVGEQGALWALDGKNGNWKQIHFLDNSSKENGYILTGIWGNSDGKIWIMGTNFFHLSQIGKPVSFQFDGMKWQPLPFMDGLIYQQEYNGDIRTKILSFETNDIWAVVVSAKKNPISMYQYLYHFEQGQWVPRTFLNGNIDLPYRSIDYHAVWGLSAHDLWFPNSEGTWNLQDLNKWVYIPVNDDSIRAKVWTIWGTSSKNLWFALDQGGLAHFDGQQIDWNSDALNTMISGNLWLRSDNEFWTNLDRSLFYSLAHWQKNSFTLEKQPSASIIWPVDNNHAFIQDRNSQSWSFSGSAWQYDSSFPSPSDVGYINDFQGILSNQALAMTHSTLLSYNGSVWQNQKTLYDQLSIPPSSDFYTTLSNIFWVNSLHDAWFSGQDCDHLPGEAYCDLEKGSMNRYWLKHSSNLTDVDNKIPVARLVLGFWGSDSTHLWILQEGNSGLLFSDGKNLLKDGDPTQFGKANLEKEQPLGMWGRSASDIWLKTKNAQEKMGLYHYNGSTWKKKTLPAAFSEDAQLTGSQNGTGIWIHAGNVIVHYQPELDKNP